MNTLNKDKLLELAKEAGHPYPEADAAFFERFAALLSAAQAERESAKPYAYEYGHNNGDGTYSVNIHRGEFPAYITPHKDWPVKPLYLAPPSSDQVWNEAVEEAEVVAGYSGLAPTNEVGRAYMQGREDAAENVRTLKRPLQAQEPAKCFPCAASRFCDEGKK